MNNKDTFWSIEGVELHVTREDICEIYNMLSTYDKKELNNTQKELIKNFKELSDKVAKRKLPYKEDKSNLVKEEKPAKTTISNMSFPE